MMSKQAEMKYVFGNFTLENIIAYNFFILMAMTTYNEFKNEERGKYCYVDH